MKPRIIKTQADYDETMARIDTLIDSDPDPTSDDGIELELLSMLVEQYEEQRYPIGKPVKHIL